MFNNIGKKLKNFAIGIFIVESLAGIIGGIALIVDSGDPHPLGLALIFLSPFVAYGSAMFLYAFGELVDKTVVIERNTRHGEVKSEVQKETEDTRIAHLEKLRAQGLITEEEFQQAVAKKQ